MYSEETDKVYFRKKDEIVNYAEAYVKCAGTLRKNWASLIPIMLRDWETYKIRLRKL